MFSAKALALTFSLLVSSQAYSFDHSYAEWDKMLKSYVVMNGPISTVKYKAWKADRAGLDNFTNSLSAVSKADYNKWNDKQKLSFLINTYNAFTVKLILDNYPVKSIKDLGSFLKSPWKKKFFKLFGEDSYLDYVEHEVIRKDFKESRIHFAVVCASIGCPQLLNEAFTEAKIDAQLEAGAKAFLSDSTRNRWNKEKNLLELSSIFKWYGDDFKKSDGSVQNFVSTRMGKDSTEIEMIKKAKIDFLSYDWNLNESL